MSRTAYGDESIRRTGVSEPMYLLGTYVDDEHSSGLPDALDEYARNQGKLHWHDHTRSTKRAVCEEIGRCAAKHLIVMAAPLGPRLREESARQQALQTLMVILIQTYGVRSLVMERRQKVQDDKDQRSAAIAVNSGMVARDFKLTHRFGGNERKLWVPDQVLGAFGDAQAGMSAGWELIERRVRVEKISPR